MTKEQRAYILDQMDEILGIKLDPADFEDDHDSKTTEDQAPVGNEVTSFTSTPAAHGNTHQNTPSAHDSVDPSGNFGAPSPEKPAMASFESPFLTTCT
jgi:hypothetical protein